MIFQGRGPCLAGECCKKETLTYIGHIKKILCGSDRAATTIFQQCHLSVSYTHLTLPTMDSV